MNVIPKEVIDMTKLDFKKIAEEICSVQPMDANLMSNLIKAGSSEKELIEKGYEPVSHHRLMWKLKYESED